LEDGIVLGDLLDSDEGKVLLVSKVGEIDVIVEGSEDIILFSDDGVLLGFKLGDFDCILETSVEEDPEDDGFILLVELGSSLGVEEESSVRTELGTNDNLSEGSVEGCTVTSALGIFEDNKEGTAL
jgi:hypothetical protein